MIRYLVLYDVDAIQAYVFATTLDPIQTGFGSV